MFKVIFQFSKLFHINILRKTTPFKISSENIKFKRHIQPVILGFLPLVTFIECKHLVMNDASFYVVKQAVNNMDTKDIKQLLQEGEYLIHKQHQYERGEQLLLQALHRAIEEKSEFVPRIQDTLANMYLHQEKYENAEKLFINILQQLLAAGSTPSDPAVIEISLKLSVLYAHQDKHELALNGFSWTLEQCRTIVDKKAKRPTSADQRNNMALLGMILDSYGRYLYAKNDNKGALKCTLEAAEISKQLYGDNDRRTLVLYNDVASMCGSLGHKADSLKYVSNVISHCEAAKPRIPSSDEAVFYSNYSIILSLNGRGDEAVNALKKALVAASATNDKQLKQYVGSLASKISLK